MSTPAASAQRMLKVTNPSYHVCSPWAVHFEIGLPLWRHMLLPPLCTCVQCSLHSLLTVAALTACKNRSDRSRRSEISLHKIGRSEIGHFYWIGVTLPTRGPLKIHHKSFSGTGSPRLSWKRGHKPIVVVVNVNGNSVHICWSATVIITQVTTCHQQCFAVSALAADWHELRAKQCIMWPSAAHTEDDWTCSAACRHTTTIFSQFRSSFCSVAHTICGTAY